MEGSNYLILLAELAIALAGFAGIVATYQFKESAKITRGDAVGLALIVHCGLVDTFFAVLPMVIFSFGASEQLAWNISSAMHCVNYFLYFFYIRANMRGVQIRKTSFRLVYAGLFLSMGVIFLLNLLNALNIGFHGEFGPYFLACIMPLCLAGYMFARLVLRPLWKSIIIYEAGHRQVSEAGQAP